MNENLITGIKALEVFSYKNQQIRTVNYNGSVWFVAKDVCDVLGIKNVTDALKSLDDDEKMTLDKSESHSGQRGGAQFLNIISESGVYGLALRSNKPEAKNFARWVRKEVLPQIREHGMYLTGRALELYKNDPEIFSKMLENYAETQELKKRVQELEEQVAREQSFTVLGKVVYGIPKSVPFKDGADLMSQFGVNIGQNRLFKLARDLKLLCSRRGQQWNKPTQLGLQKGYVSVQISNGFRTQTMLTPHGLKFFTDMLVKENYPLLALMDNEA